MDPRSSSSGEDRISGLPDELLHVILVRLRCARAAARTSVLSGRWRHVWTYMPELVLDDGGPDAPPSLPPRASFMDTVDAALRACLAPALECLTIGLSCARDTPPASRVAPWLRFASQHVVGTLNLYVLCLPNGDVEEEEAALELPTCKRAKNITLFMVRPWRLCLPPVGMFAALTSLTIRYGRVEGSELTALVCRQCPRLKILNLVTTLVVTSDVTICSDSLHSAWVWLKNTRRLEIVAPGLELLSLSDTIEARISAPKLGKLIWYGNVYDPRLHQFVDVGNRLQQLRIEGRQAVVASLMRQFDEVDELKLEIYIPRQSPCPLSCHCRFEENRRIDNISLNSLEEVTISSYASPCGELEFVEHLQRCNAPILKRLVIENMISAAPPTKETCEKIRNMCRPNIKVEFYLLSSKGMVRCE
ncbi:unnamed protein product [Urochloa decumbens]|uniref:F-box/LRR-repeat protein 15/At3g58940/PEG3-like LRR domain-containing protein n=1 Tax=Urochloa decumbens TaxID=240449 RepID=A0ABC9BR68_9POAL